MLQTKIAGAIAALALLAAPGVAAAHSNGHHKGKHHSKKHAKKAQAREVTGTATATVASFTNGELTITLPSGKTFSALVTDRTNIDCQTAAPTPAPTAATASRHGDDGDDDNGADDNGANGANGSVANGANPSAQGDDDGDDDGDNRGGRFDDGDDDDNGDDNGNGRCDTTALVAGTKVSDAELSLTGGEATWKQVELLK
jgi:hypothetical protein